MDFRTSEQSTFDMLIVIQIQLQKKTGVAGWEKSLHCVTLHNVTCHLFHILLKKFGSVLGPKRMPVYSDCVAIDKMGLNYTCVA